MVNLWSFMDRVMEFGQLLHICLIFGHLWIGLWNLASYYIYMLNLWSCMDRVREFEQVLHICLI